MWYTHYLDKQLTALNQDQRDLANRLYRALLASIRLPIDNTLTLLDVIQAQNAHAPVIYGGSGMHHDTRAMYDQYFHEFTWLPRTNEPALFPDVQAEPYTAGWECIKTDRKLYDLAVWMTLQAVQRATWVRFKSDSMFDTDVDCWTYASSELALIPPGSYDIQRMYGLQQIAQQHIIEKAVVLPWLPLPDPADIVDDETRIGHLTIYGKANVWDLRHIADMIEKWEIFSPADWSYQWQPSWVFTKS